jgi:hypothetical protein
MGLIADQLNGRQTLGVFHRHPHKPLLLVEPTRRPIEPLGIFGPAVGQDFLALLHALDFRVLKPVQPEVNQAIGEVAREEQQHHAQQEGPPEAERPRQLARAVGGGRVGNVRRRHG